MKSINFAGIMSIVFAAVFFSCGSEEIPRVTLTTAVTPAGSGTVSPAGANIEKGKTVSLTAIPTGNYVFEKWEGGYSGTSNPAEILMDGNKSVTAVFKVKGYPLNITIVGKGSVKETIITNPSGREYPEGTWVELTAEPFSDSFLESWSGDLSGRAYKVKILVDKPKNVTATFEELKDIVDARDGKSYKRIRINDQVWLAENMDFETPQSKCLEDKSEMCEELGRLYTWEDALTACPAGWHLSTKDDWEKLIEFAGGREQAYFRLKSKESLGIDLYGWNGRLSGRWYNDPFSGPRFLRHGEVGNWWTPSELQSDKTRALAYGMNMASLFDGNFVKERFMMSCRCVMD